MGACVTAAQNEFKNLAKSLVWLVSQFERRIQIFSR